MTSRIELGTIESLQVTRSEDEYGNIEFRIRTEDGESLKFTVGRFYDDAATLAELLTGAAKDADGIVRDWRDLPDESDGFVFDSRDGYFAQLDGTSNPDNRTHDGGRRFVKGFPTRDIATYELAKMMVDAGYFPNVWYEGERGWSEDIGADVRKFHDEGGDKLLPLSGVEYEDGADVIADGLSAYVVKGYGTLGIIYVLSGDDEERFTDDRADVRGCEDSDDGCDS